MNNLVGDRMPVQIGIHWLSIVPIAESRSSYNGLLVFFSSPPPPLSRRLRFTAWRRTSCAKAPPWDCGFPDANPATQYTATSFAEPIRRVYGAFAFRARERVDMPPPVISGRRA